MPSSTILPTWLLACRRAADHVRYGKHFFSLTAVTVFGHWEREQEEGVMVVPVVDVGAAAAALQGEMVALQQDIIPVPAALLEPINNQVLYIQYL